MKTLIFSGGNFTGLPEGISLSDYALTIAADKGYLYAESAGIIPDIFVGDFDSLPKDTAVKSQKVYKLNPIKDATDTKEAIDIAILSGATEITILGALGGRIDHTLGNIGLLKYGQEKGIPVTLADRDNEIILVNQSAKIAKKEGFCLSLIPLTTCSGVTVSGVYYPLDDATLTFGTTLGISNEFVENSATVEVKEGILLLAVCRK